MSDEYVVSDISHAVEIGIIMTQSWFRGHAKDVEHLTPRVFREDLIKGMNNPYRDAHASLTRGAPAGREGPEVRLIDAFKRGAPSLTDNLPRPNHNAEWLFLMQHHGLPTRLLDWSESVLVALYFATDGPCDEDGVLFVMRPTELNARNDEDDLGGMPTVGNPIVQYLANEPLYPEPYLAQITGLKSPPKYPFALDPVVGFARVAAQLSTFTIHPQPREGYTIPDLLTEKRDLCIYKIPGRRKDELRGHLASLGVTSHSLFRDLDSLSETSVARLRRPKHVPPDPPVFPY